MGVIDELGDLVADGEDAAGPSVVPIGRHGRGSGFVVAPGRVLTNAHNLRDETTLVRFGDGRAVQGSIVGSDVDGDLVVLDVDTADVAPLAWADDAVAPGDVVVTVTAGRDQRRSAWGQVTATEAGFRGPRGPPDRRRHRARHAVRSRLVGGAGARPHRSGRRHQHAPPRARLLPGPRRRPAAARRRGGDGRGPALRAPAARRGAGPGRRRHPPARVGRPRRAGRAARARRRRGLAGATRPALREGDLLVRAGDRDLAVPDDLFAVLATVQPGGELTIGVVRGAEALDVTVTFPA